jgi:hypothetical protein
VLLPLPEISTTLLDWPLPLPEFFTSLDWSLPETAILLAAPLPLPEFRTTLLEWLCRGFARDHDAARGRPLGRLTFALTGDRPPARAGDSPFARVALALALALAGEYDLAFYGLPTRNVSNWVKLRVVYYS